MATRRRRARSNRRRVRRNFYGAGMLANRPRRRRIRHNRRRRARRNVYMPMMNRRRRHVRRRGFAGNPGGRKLFGLSLPPMDEVLFGTAGLIVPNLVSSKILEFLPTSWKTGTDGKPNQLTMWVTQIAAVLIPGIAIRKFIGPRAGNSFLIGGLAGLSLNALKTFAPGIIPGIGSQPLLGAYFDTPRAVASFPRAAGNRVPSMIATAPGRLDPQERY